MTPLLMTQRPKQYGNQRPEKMKAHETGIFVKKYTRNLNNNIHIKIIGNVEINYMYSNIINMQSQLGDCYVFHEEIRGIIQPNVT